MQFSLKDILLGTTAVAASCTALTFATPFWAHLYFSVSTLMLLTALLLAYAAKRERRAYWIGFALFGWGYWILLHSPILDIESSSANWGLYSQSPLFTATILDWLYDNALSQVHEQPVADRYGTLVANSSGYPSGPDFFRVGHSIFAMLFALVGGEIGRRAFQQHNPEADDVNHDN